DAGDGLQAVQLLAVGLALHLEALDESCDLLLRRGPDRVVSAHEGMKARADRDLLQKLLPCLHAREAPHGGQPRAPQQALDRVDLHRADPDEVAPAAQGLADRLDLFGRNVDARSVDPAAQALAQLDRVAPVALLVRAQGLCPDFLGIDHHRLEPKPLEPARDKEGHRAALERNLRSLRKLFALAQQRQASWSRRDGSPANTPTVLILDLVDAALAVGIESDVACVQG